MDIFIDRSTSTNMPKAPLKTIERGNTGTQGVQPKKRKSVRETSEATKSKYLVNAELYNISPSEAVNARNLVHLFVDLPGGKAISIMDLVHKLKRAGLNGKPLVENAARDKSSVIRGMASQWNSTYAILCEKNGNSEQTSCLYGCCATTPHRICKTKGQGYGGKYWMRPEVHQEIYGEFLNNNPDAALPSKENNATENTTEDTSEEVTLGEPVFDDFFKLLPQQAPTIPLMSSVIPDDYTLDPFQHDITDAENDEFLKMLNNEDTYSWMSYANTDANLKDATFPHPTIDTILPVDTSLLIANINTDYKASKSVKTVKTVESVDSVELPRFPFVEPYDDFDLDAILGTF